MGKSENIKKMFENIEFHSGCREVFEELEAENKTLKEENRILKSDKYHAESNLEIAEDPNFISVPKELSLIDAEELNEILTAFAEYGHPIWPKIIKHFTPEQGGEATND